MVKRALGNTDKARLLARGFNAYLSPIGSYHIKTMLIGGMRQRSPYLQCAFKLAKTANKMANFGGLHPKLFNLKPNKTQILVSQLLQPGWR